MKLQFVCFVGILILLSLPLQAVAQLFLHSLKTSVRNLLKREFGKGVIISVPLEFLDFLKFSQV